MTNKTNKKSPRTQTGFTLIETLIAVVVLMMSISGPLTLAAKGLQATLIAKDQETAFFLAQDAIEYVRWVRDTNKLKGNSWLAGLDGTANSFTQIDSANGDCVSSTGAQKCYINSLQPLGQNAITSCGAAGAVCGTAINYDGAYNDFSYTSGSPTIFTRTVQIQLGVCNVGATICNNSEAAVTVLVIWSDQAGITRNATVRENIYDWQ